MLQEHVYRMLLSEERACRDGVQWEVEVDRRNTGEEYEQSTLYVCIKLRKSKFKSPGPHTVKEKKQRHAKFFPLSHQNYWHTPWVASSFFLAWLKGFGSC